MLDYNTLNKELSICGFVNKDNDNKHYLYSNGKDNIELEVEICLDTIIFNIRKYIFQELVGNHWNTIRMIACEENKRGETLSNIVGEYFG